MLSSPGLCSFKRLNRKSKYIHVVCFSFSPPLSLSHTHHIVTSFPTLPPILPSSLSLNPTATGKTLVAGVGGVESNFFVQSVPCIKSHDHADYPAILVFIEYLTALEVRAERHGPHSIPPVLVPMSRVQCGVRSGEWVWPTTTASTAVQTTACSS